MNATLKLEGSGRGYTCAEPDDYRIGPEERAPGKVASILDFDPKKRKRETELVIVERRLSEWADWAKRHRQVLGYPSISALFRIMMDSKRVLLPSMAEMAEGHLISAHGKQTQSFREDSVFVPEAIAEVDSAVAKLPRKLERVITANYFTYGCREIRAKAAGLKVARFKQLLEAAKYSVWAALVVNQDLEHGSHRGHNAPTEFD